VFDARRCRRSEPIGMLADELLTAWDVARIPRRHLVAPGTVNHCTWRSHNFTRVLASDEAKQRFLALLAEHKDDHGIEILSYSLMDSHPHVQCRSRLGQRAFSRFWQIVNYRFARWYNRRNAARGQVVMERMHSGQVQDASHQLAVMRYGDLNPVRAGLVRSAKDWHWSSYRHYAFGEPDPLITSAAAYAELGATPALRRKAYVQFFARLASRHFRVRRPDLVANAFIGDEAWTTDRFRTLVPAAPS
jgi:putative transposase